jgi:outer membrane protein W
MTKALRAMAVVAALAFAGTAEAQFALDLKVAYAIPTGDVVSGAALSSGVSGGMPFEVAGRYRFTPNLSAGAYFQWGPAFVKSGACEAGATCSASDMRIGLEAMYAFMPDGAFNPWVSLGTGWEWLFLSDTSVNPSSSTLSGWEYFNVQAGVDFPLSRLFALGPYVGYFGGSYTSNSASTGSIPSEFRAFHGWFQIGAKGTFNF